MLMSETSIINSSISSGVTIPLDAIKYCSISATKSLVSWLVLAKSLVFYMSNNSLAIMYFLFLWPSNLYGIKNPKGIRSASISFMIPFFLRHF